MNINNFLDNTEIINNIPTELNDDNICIKNGQIGIGGTSNIEEDSILKIYGNVDIQGKIFSKNYEWDMLNSSILKKYQILHENSNIIFTNDVYNIKIHLFGGGGSSYISNDNIIYGHPSNYDYINIPINNADSYTFIVGEKGLLGNDGYFSEVLENNISLLKVYGGNGYNTIKKTNIYIYNIANNNLLIKTDISDGNIINILEFEFSENITAEPILDNKDEYIYVYSLNLYKINTKTFELIWVYKLNNNIEYKGIIDDDDNFLYLGDINGEIYKFNIKTDNLEKSYKLDFGISTNLIIDEYNEYIYCGISLDISTNTEIEKYSNIFCKLDIDNFINNSFINEFDIDYNISDTNILYNGIFLKDSIILDDNNFIFLCLKYYLIKLDYKSFIILEFIIDEQYRKISSAPFFSENYNYIYFFVDRINSSSDLIKINKYNFYDDSSVSFGTEIEAENKILLQKQEYKVNNIDSVYTNLYINYSQNLECVNINNYISNWKYTLLTGNNIVGNPILTIDNQYIYLSNDIGEQFMINTDGTLFNKLSKYTSLTNYIYNKKINKKKSNIPLDIIQYEYLNPGYSNKNGLIILEINFKNGLYSNKKTIINNNILCKNLKIFDQNIDINQNNILINFNEIINIPLTFKPNDHIHPLNYSTNDDIIDANNSQYIRNYITYNYHLINSDTTINFVNKRCEILIVSGGGGSGTGVTNGAGGSGEIIHEHNVFLNGSYDFTIGKGGSLENNGGNTIMKNNTNTLYNALGGGAGDSVYTYFDPNIHKITNVGIGRVSTGSNGTSTGFNFLNRTLRAYGGKGGIFGSTNISVNYPGYLFIHPYYPWIRFYLIAPVSNNYDIHIPRIVQAGSLYWLQVDIHTYEAIPGNSSFIRSNYLIYNKYSNQTQTVVYTTKNNILARTYRGYFTSTHELYTKVPESYGHGGGYTNLYENALTPPSNGCIIIRYNNDDSTIYTHTTDNEIILPNNISVVEFFLIGAGGDYITSYGRSSSLQNDKINIYNELFVSSGSSGSALYAKFEAKNMLKNKTQNIYGSGGGITGKNYLYDYKFNISNNINIKGSNDETLYINNGGKNVNDTTGGSGGGATSSGNDNGIGGDGYNFTYEKDIIVGIGGSSAGTLIENNENDIYYGKGGNTSESDREGTDGVIIIIYKTPIVDNINYKYTESTQLYNSFTGQHYTIINNNIINQGYIVSTTGKYQDINSSYHSDSISRNINISQALPIVEYSVKEKDKKCFGVIDYMENYENIYRDNGYNNFYNSIKKNGDNRLVVNSIGEGSIWVSNYNGLLENGDYITSSPLKGIGMKQDEDYVINYTVAKITMDCDFHPDKIEIKKSTELYKKGLLHNALDENENIIYENTNIIEDRYEIKYVDINGNIKDTYNSNTDFIMAFVGCTYHCG